MKIINKISTLLVGLFTIGALAWQSSANAVYTQTASGFQYGLWGNASVSWSVANDPNAAHPWQYTYNTFATPVISPNQINPNPLVYHLFVQVPVGALLSSFSNLPIGTFIGTIGGYPAGYNFLQIPNSTPSSSNPFAVVFESNFAPANSQLYGLVVDLTNGNNAVTNMDDNLGFSGIPLVPNGAFTVAVAPEPATLLLLASSLGLAALKARRKKVA